LEGLLEEEEEGVVGEVGIGKMDMWGIRDIRGTLDKGEVEDMT